MIEYQGLVLTPDNHVSWQGRKARLVPQAAKMLGYLMQHPREIVPFEKLGEVVERKGADAVVSRPHLAQLLAAINRAVSSLGTTLVLHRQRTVGIALFDVLNGSKPAVCKSCGRPFLDATE